MEATSLFVKHVFDICVAGVVLLLTSPVWLITILAIWLETGWPIFYKHLRVGQYGRLFLMYKFRSMLQDADKMGGPLTLGDDPRVTRVGRFIRKWKIDELPNLINVLRGEMSLVGPRAESPQYVALYTPDQRRVFDVKPGITDMAHSGIYRNEEQILASVSDPEEYYVSIILPEYIRLSLEYVEKAPSLSIDIRILMRTFWSVLSAKFLVPDVPDAT